MKSQKYSVNQHLIETILAWVNSGEIAIPEIQRPFVWDATKVRDLMDSLYKGYPIGYVIVWKNPTIRLKDGTLSDGKKILIDGQQRVTALTAAILGNKIVNLDYKKIRIQIAFNPIEERFEVFNPAIAKDITWIPDIADVVSGKINILEMVDEYLSKNKSLDRNDLYKRIENLTSIIKKQIGLIELSPELEIDTVTEIFIRINSQGVVLKQADFAMSKIAADSTYGGADLRKCIDYFCHLSVAPEWYSHIVEVDKEFTKTDFFQKMSWLKNENDDLYDPQYDDVLRVAFTSEFNRGKLSDLVSLLSGRNFETRTYEEAIEKESFAKLKNGVMNFINETNFNRFLMIIRSAGFVSTDMVRSQNTLNFAYALYLKLKLLNYQPHDIETFVRRWFVLTVLTGRYSGSPESKFEFDIKNASSKPFKDYLTDVEKAELSDAFWSASLVQSLNTSVASSPYFHVYLASQVKSKDKGFLSKEISVEDLVTHKGDIHHIFPKDYLKKSGLSRGDYNQIANYVYMQSEINIKVANKSPEKYFGELKNQCTDGGLKYGGIKTIKELQGNLVMHCIPEDIFNMEHGDYEQFLQKRRLLMANKIKDYYYSL